MARRTMRVLALALLALLAVAVAGAQAESAALRAGAGAQPRRSLSIFRTKDEEAAHKQQREALVNVRPARSVMARAHRACAAGPPGPGARNQGFALTLAPLCLCSGGVQAAGGGGGPGGAGDRRRREGRRR